MAAFNHAPNLGFFADFMKGYGRADYPARAELWRDTQAYSGGAETADQLYAQVGSLLGVFVPSPQRYAL